MLSECIEEGNWQILTMWTNFTPLFEYSWSLILTTFLITTLVIYFISIMTVGTFHFLTYSARVLALNTKTFIYGMLNFIHTCNTITHMIRNFWSYIFSTCPHSFCHSQINSRVLHKAIFYTEDCVKTGHNCYKCGLQSDHIKVSFLWKHIRGMEVTQMSNLSKRSRWSGQSHTLTILSLGKETLIPTDWRQCALEPASLDTRKMFIGQEINHGYPLCSNY